MSEPLVSVITVNFNQAEVTLALLESLSQQDYPAIEVIVIDNGSTHDPADLFQRHYPAVRYRRSDINLGFAGGNNLALKQATGEYVFFINNDTEVTMQCIGYLVDFCKKTPQVGAVSPLICYFDQKADAAPDLIQYAGMSLVSACLGRNKTMGERTLDQGQFVHPVPTAYAHGAAMFVPRTVIDKVGPMAEDFFLYYEELDWCERIRRAGFGVWVYPMVRIYHKESLTVAKMGALKTYFHTRNRLLFMQRNRSTTVVWFYLYFLVVVSPKALLQYLFKGDWPNLRAFAQALGWHFVGLKNAWEQLAAQGKD